MSIKSEQVDAEIVVVKPLVNTTYFDDSEAGQTSLEYTAITAVGLLTAIVITWTVLGDALNSALTTILDRLMDFMANPPAF